jgi:putative membrane protein
MTFQQKTALMAFGVSTAFAATAFSQQATQPVPQPKVQPGVVVEQPKAARPAVQPGVQVIQPGIQQQTTNFRGSNQAQSNEQALASCVAIENQTEVAIAQFAENKAKDKDVKEFAKMLVEEHQAFLKKLQRFAPEAAADGYLDQTASNDSQVQPAGGANQQRPAATAQQRQGQVIQQTAAETGAGLDITQLHREIAQQCLTDAKKGLSEKEGRKFDTCFIGHQIACHEMMKTKLTVFQRHASGEFAELLNEGLQATEKHLKKAEKIMSQLDSNDSRKSDSKTTKND